MTNLFNKLHSSKLLASIFSTLNSCLKRELKKCSTVLDIGCGPSSPLQHCESIEYSVGVEPYKPYLQKTKEKNIHNDYYDKKIESLNFEKNQFDAVIMLEVIEHLPKDAGFELLKRSEKWAKKKIIISTPNGFLEQGESDENPLQRHRSGWGVEELHSFGLAGLKLLRCENQDDSMVEGNLLSSIRWQPKPFWFGVATLSQALTYYLPNFAFELFGVKEL
ncbi:MAG: class I SAM-dependent methyltransferase [Patescibacteria group bacterium]|nr:class I SAM-dependent methyltransferase [Patescibacteria group bacterium]